MAKSVRQLKRLVERSVLHKNSNEATNIGLLDESELHTALSNTVIPTTSVVVLHSHLSTQCHDNDTQLPACESRMTKHQQGAAPLNNSKLSSQDDQSMESDVLHEPLLRMSPQHHN